MTSVASSAPAIQAAVEAIARDWASARPERQRRRELDPADFTRLVDAGFLLTGVPVEAGGIIESIPASTRAVAELLRTLAHADSSVALVAAMHPVVLATTGWLALPEAPPPYTDAWAAQRRWAFQTATEGAWWGTITSEPGSGGDMRKTKAVARRAEDGTFRLSGQKHFGSGSGITAFMMTTALPEREAEPDIFFIDMRGLPWDGSAGVTLTAPWDGFGMTATQSHAMLFADMPVQRVDWPDFGARTEAALPVGGFGACLFTAVIVGIVEEALATATRQLGTRYASLRPYEQVEWTRARTEGWLIEQAYEGMLRATETANGRGTLIGKTAIAELAESVLARLPKVVGGGAYSRQSPFGFWYEDVRALGYLRPPWGFAYDQLHAAAAPLPTD